jgi:DNA-binding CsgD family transcriptional regulator
LTKTHPQSKLSVTRLTKLTGIQSMARFQDTILTPREREVVSLVGRGLTNQEIGRQLCITTSAVKISLHQASTKLKARNRAQLVILALKKGAVDPRELYSVEELADLLASLDPEAMETIAQLMKQRPYQSRTLRPDK